MTSNSKTTKWIQLTHDNLAEVKEFINSRMGKNCVYNEYQAKTQRGTTYFYTHQSLEGYEKITEGTWIGVIYNGDKAVVLCTSYLNPNTRHK